MQSECTSHIPLHSSISRDTRAKLSRSVSLAFPSMTSREITSHSSSLTQTCSVLLIGESLLQFMTRRIQSSNNSERALQAGEPRSINLVLPATFSLETASTIYISVFVATNTLRASQLFGDFAQVKWLKGLAALSTVFEARLFAFTAARRCISMMSRLRGLVDVSPGSRTRTGCYTVDTLVPSVALCIAFTHQCLGPGQ